MNISQLPPLFTPDEILHLHVWPEYFHKTRYYFVSCLSKHPSSDIKVNGEMNDGVTLLYR